MTTHANPLNCLKPLHTGRGLILASALVLLNESLSLGLYAKETIRDDTLGFKLTIPDGFKRNDNLAGSAAEVAYGFSLDDGDESKLDVMLFIEKMRGVIGRTELKPEDFPEDFKGRPFKTKWQGFEIDAFEVPGEFGVLKTVTFNAQVPLKRRAIQVKLFGPADRKPEMNRLLKQVLNGLEGESNWSRSSPNPAGATDDDYAATFIVLAGLVALVGFIVVWMVREKNRARRRRQLWRK